MNQIILNFEGIADRAALHDYLAEAFALPEYYGRNLDALWDCLYGSFREPTTLVLEGLYTLPEGLFPSADALRALFLELEERDPMVTVQE